MHLTKCNESQIFISYMFRYKGAILRVFCRSKEYKPKKLIQMSGGTVLQHRTRRNSHASSAWDLFESQKSRQIFLCIHYNE